MSAPHRHAARAGQRSDARVPPFARGSVNARVVERLREIAEIELEEEERGEAAGKPAAPGDTGV